MILYEWARRHGVSMRAVQELVTYLTSVQTQPNAPTDARAGSEASNQNLTRIDAARNGAILWRNNVGACTDENGNFIRYGLCNESAQINDACKSSDLVGIKKVEIVPAMVGSVIGQFVAREMKPSDWQYGATKREQAQLKFIDLVNGMGGDAKFNNTGRF